MNAVAQSCALIGALVYIEVFPLESFLLRRPSVQQFLSTPAANVPAVMMWAFNNAFRNPSNCDAFAAWAATTRP